MGVLKFSCGHCSQVLEAPEEAAGGQFSCPNCSQPIEVPMPATAKVSSASAEQVCAICLSSFTASDAKTSCPSCQAEYHTDCWTENGGCAVYGCSQAPVVESRRAIEIPMSYWGQENKNCPKCGQQILAAAVRCRHCGTTFESARPQEVDEFRQRTDLTGRLPAAKTMIVWIFVASVIPCFAPIGAVWGLIWSSTHKEEIRTLPTLY
ncbi:MAG TPA: RING finger protein, partial [Candidatus Polarisedimenticolia bacterium]|nr:RING finger protein [Candidatus Polarisedimenticolia bacterium]